MFKLIKYEFRKQAFSKLVILAILGLIEVVFLIGIGLNKEDMVGNSMGILVLFTFGALFFLAFESIITFNGDLKQKQSYMLFLTPNTTYGIVGSKVLYAAIQIVLAGIAFAAVFAVNGGILVAKYSSIAQIKEMILQGINQLYNIDVKTSYVILAIILVICTWLSTVTVAFFSITLSSTFLADKRFKGFVSFVIFLLLNYVFSFISEHTIGNLDINQNINLYLILEILYMLCFTVITYVGTAWMLDKKVSV
ncbi:MAG: hypothetical protein K0S61_2134 [Anaerocolumna sp.]|jgi:hypothetical protein|nr:hypothetical protein [Anaerocolumna sp.]